MLEATINGWILTMGGDRYVYTDKQVPPIAPTKVTVVSPPLAVY